jgi:hypothetical protein
MATSLIAKLPKEEWQQLLNDLNYLNMAEIKSFCQRHSIPYRISIEAEDSMRSHVHQIGGLSSFLTDPTIPEAFQFVDWHQPL